MDYFKKAKSQAKAAVKEAQSFAQQLQNPYQQQSQQYYHGQQNGSQAPAYYQTQAQPVQGYYNSPNQATNHYGQYQQHPYPQPVNHHGQYQQPPLPQPVSHHVQYPQPPFPQPVNHQGQYQQSSPLPVSNRNGLFQQPPPAQPATQYGRYQQPSPFPAPNHNGLSQQPPPPPPVTQSGQYQQPLPSPPTQNPQPDSFNMSAVSNALPDSSLHQVSLSIDNKSPPTSPYNVSHQSMQSQVIVSGPLPASSNNCETNMSSHVVGAPSNTKCPGHEPALFDMVQFYVFSPDVLEQESIKQDELSICVTCYKTTIAPHPQIAAGFIARLPDDQHAHKDAPKASFGSASCDFHLPGLRAIFHRECLSQKSYMPMLQYIKFLATLPACTGDVISGPSEFYFVKRTNDSATCRRCYEQYIRGSTFEYEVERRMSPGDWMCDGGIGGYVFKNLREEVNSPRPDIMRFAQNANNRATLAPCPGEGNPLAQPGERAFVYEASNGKTGCFCQACFFDHVKDTPMEKHFSVYNELEDQYKGNIECDLAGGPSKFAMECAIRFNNDEVWRSAVTGRSALPRCKGSLGIDEEELQGQDSDSSRWYCVTDHPRIEICQTCYVTTVELLGAAHMFSPITRPLVSGVVRMCYLTSTKDFSADMADSKNFENTLTWRGVILRNWLHQGYDSRGNFAAFQQAAAAIAQWPHPCTNERMLKPASGRKWYGNHFHAKDDENKTGFTYCEECFANYVKDTPLEWFIGVDLTEKVNNNNPNGFVCNSDTPRTREVLAEACKAGDFHILARHWAKRKEVEARWKAINVLCQKQADKQKAENVILDAQNAAASIRLMQQLNANTNATIMGIGGSVAEAAAPDFGQRYGNSTVGYEFLTPNGASAAQAHHDAQKLAGQQGLSVNDYQPSGNTWQDTQRLLQISRLIEAEWNAIK